MIAHIKFACPTWRSSSRIPLCVLKVAHIDLHNIFCCFFVVWATTIIPRYSIRHVLYTQSLRHLLRVARMPRLAHFSKASPTDAVVKALPRALHGRTVLLNAHLSVLLQPGGCCNVYGSFLIACLAASVYKVATG